MTSKKKKTIGYYLGALRIDLSLSLIFCDLIQMVCLEISMNQRMLFILFYGVYVLMMEIIRSMVFYFDIYLGPENLYIAIHNAWMA